MKHISDFPHKIKEMEDVGITMPDGCRISARVWMPENAQKTPMPAILEHLPYRKRDGTIVRDEYTHPWLAGHGYVCIRTDMRGTGDSQGIMEDEYTEQELDDAQYVIEWAAKQKWCNGNVGMMGISWGGFNALQVASRGVEALKAIITICSSVDRYADDIHYKGGAMLTTNFGWAVNMLSYSSRPPDEKIVGEIWKKMWEHRLEKLPFNWTEWTQHQHRDKYWKRGSICEEYANIKIPVLSIGGWHDGYRNAIAELVENIQAPVKGIVGPWIHKYPHYARPKPAIGFLQEAKKWWDSWLKNDQEIAKKIKKLPDYRIYAMDSCKPKRWYDERKGIWIAYDKWPSKQIEQKIFHLGGDNTLNLNQETENLNLSVMSPHDCGENSGTYFPFSFGDELPDEQSKDDERSIVFDSPVLDELQNLVGAPHVCMTLKVDKPVAQIAMRLCDLRPDGTSALISHGFLNLTHHKSHETPKLLTPNKPFNINVQLDQIAYRIPAGHRLRLAISTAYWPLMWPTPETATIIIEKGCVNVPMHNGEIQECTFQEPQGADEWKAENMRKGEYKRTSQKNPENGMVTHTLDADFGANRDCNHGLISDSWEKQRFSIHPKDPLSARHEIEWQQIGGRENKMWKTHVNGQMWSDKTHFYAKAKVKVFENEEVILEKQYEDKVRRNCV